MSKSSTKALTFHDVQFDVVDRNNQPWLRSPQIAEALGYSDESSTNRIYARNSDEFTDNMTCSVKLTDQTGQARDVRIFSLRGCHLLAMFARTKVAKEFRKWVLDILDKVNSEKPTPLALQGPPITPKQYKELNRKVELIEECFHRGEAARQAAWARLRQQLSIPVTIRNLPAAQFEAALILLEVMHQHALSFRSDVTVIEREFFKRVLKMGEDFNPDEFAAKLKEVVDPIEHRQNLGIF